MTEWQPIETAPDGISILVWLPAKDADGCETRVWPAIVTRDERGDYIQIADYGDSFGGKPEVGYSNGVNPTHWMPCPAAPA